jgi:hypothetical protein
MPYPLDSYNDNAAKIRNFIRFAHVTWNTEFVLLGGDDDTIPGRKLKDTGIPFSGDIYYACLHGSYNNQNSEEAFGILTDNEYDQIDLLAEVFVGRACVDNDEDVNNFVSKSIKYTENDKTDQYLKNALFLGERLSHPHDEDEFFGGDYLDNLIDGSNYGGYTTVGFSSEKYKIIKWYDRESYWKPDDLINRINNPYYYIHLINHQGHSNDENNMKIYIEDIPRLNNEKYFFVYSSGCSTGAFDNPWGFDCFAEEITVKTEYGAFAGIWNTDAGYFSKDDHYDCPSIRFRREFWDAIYGEGIGEIGKANQDSKEDNLWRVDEKNMRISYYELTLFGDPTISFIEPEKKAKAIDGGFDNWSIYKDSLHEFLENHPRILSILQNFQDKFLDAIH